MSEPETAGKDAGAEYAEIWGEAIHSNRHLRVISVGLGIGLLLLIIVVIRIVSVDPPRPIVVRVDEVGRAEAIAYEAMEAQADPLDPTTKRELSGYRFVSGRLTDITNAQELEMLETALTDSQFAGVDTHLQQALNLYAKREKPDYRNSIKESISAVESMAKIVSREPKATLGDALKVIEKNGLLHKSLKQGFLSLYGYTSAADGIRHAIMEKSELSSADARYFLLSCTSFVNYLKAQIT